MGVIKVINITMDQKGTYVVYSLSLFPLHTPSSSFFTCVSVSVVTVEINQKKKKLVLLNFVS